MFNVSLSLAFILGLQHALEADHVATISALLSRNRVLFRACLQGTFWGAGHTMALLVAGFAIIGFKLTISPGVAKGLELAVAFMLIYLGGRILLRSLRAWRFHRHAHAHNGHTHNHLHLHRGEQAYHEHYHFRRVGAQPFLIGLLHGMAGSAALILLVITAIPSPLGQLLFILVFGIGSTGGMLLISLLIGIPFSVTAGRWQKAHMICQALTGSVSFALGLMLAWILADV